MGTEILHDEDLGISRGVMFLLVTGQSRFEISDLTLRGSLDAEHLAKMRSAWIEAQHAEW